MQNNEKIDPVPLSELPIIADSEVDNMWVFASTESQNGIFTSGRYRLGDFLGEIAKTLQLERRISLRMETDATDMFIGENMTIYRVESRNVASLKINGVNTPMDSSISINIPPKSLVTFNIEFQMSDPVAYLFIYAKAILP